MYDVVQLMDVSFVLLIMLIIIMMIEEGIKSPECTADRVIENRFQSTSNWFDPVRSGLTQFDVE